MPKTIIEKINEKRDSILSKPEEAGREEAEQLARIAAQAIIEGPGSDAWSQIAHIYAETEEDIAKLMCKDDEFFRQNEFGRVAVAYVFGNSLCTVISARNGGTRRTMNEEFEKLLTKPS